jgi:hypothetical protein
MHEMQDRNPVIQGTHTGDGTGTPRDPGTYKKFTDHIYHTKWYPAPGVDNEWDTLYEDGGGGKVLTVSACQQECDKYAECTGVVYSTHEYAINNCWLTNDQTLSPGFINGLSVYKRL